MNRTMLAGAAAVLLVTAGPLAAQAPDKEDGVALPGWPGNYFAPPGAQLP
jgi:hypothetical protein